MANTFTPMPRDYSGGSVPSLTLGASQDVTIGVASAASVAFAGTTRIVRLVATSACRVLFGAAPTAVATSTYLSAGVPEYFTAIGGEKVAVIQETAGGKLNITEIA